MAELFQSELFITTTAASSTGYVWNVMGLQNAFVEINVRASAATLRGTLTFEASMDGVAPWLAMTNVSLIASSDGSLTFNPATGVFTILDAPSGSDLVAMLRVDRPAKFMRLNYTYTSGGGTYKIVANGYGFQQNTTP